MARKFRKVSAKSREQMRINDALIAIISKRFKDYDSSFFRTHRLLHPRSSSATRSDKVKVDADYRIRLRQLGSEHIQKRAGIIRLRKFGSEHIQKRAGIIRLRKLGSEHIQKRACIRESDAKRIARCAEILCYFSNVDRRTGELYESLTCSEYMSDFLVLCVQGIEDFVNHQHIIQKRRQSISRRLFH